MLYAMQPSPDVLIQSERRPRRKRRRKQPGERPGQRASERKDERRKREKGERRVCARAKRDREERKRRTRELTANGSEKVFRYDRNLRTRTARGHPRDPTPNRAVSPPSLSSSPLAARFLVLIDARFAPATQVPPTPPSPVNKPLDPVPIQQRDSFPRAV